MGGEHHVLDRLVAVLFRHLADGEEVAQRLAHLFVVHIDVAVVHPVARVGLASAALGLGNLVFVVGEDQVLSAAVDVDGLAQVLVDHRGALDVPARTALAPAGRPARLTRLGSLPEHKVQRVLLVLAHADARAALQLLQRLVGELAIARVLAGAEQHVAVCLVGKALILQRLDDFFDFVDGLGRLRVDGGRTDAQTLGVGQILANIALGDLLGGNALLICLLDNLVVDVGEVLHEGHIVAAELQVPAQGVKDADRAGVADVDKVIDGRPAGVHLDLARLQRDKFLLLSGEGVENFHFFISPFFDCMSKQS